jgi:hypothetical protein
MTLPTEKTMKAKAIILLLTAPLLQAGSADPIAPASTPPGKWITPLIDIRTRYEFADVNPLDSSHAFTFRERVGFKTMEWHGFSALVEGEFSQAAVDDFNGGAPGADPFDPANSPIFDPETNELNQGYLQYQGFESIGRIGRQQIVYDNAAFIGDVIWRQNQQTYDAISLTNKSVDGLTLHYAYLNQVNRIFGSDADAPLAPGFTNIEDIAASAHLFNASYTGIQNLTLGGYAYIMNFKDVGAWDNNTFGLSGKRELYGLTLYGEMAWQDKAGIAGDDDALYVHVTVSKNLKTERGDLGALTLGVEHLGQGFKTPLATVHAFNGFADVTDAARISGAHNGLADVYLAHSIPIFFGIKWMNVLHAMGDNEISTGYGLEFDSVLTKKFDDHFTAIAKFAFFDSAGDDYTNNAIADSLPDATRLSLELNYTF